MSSIVCIKVMKEGTLNIIKLSHSSWHIFSFHCLPAWLHSAGHGFVWPSSGSGTLQARQKDVFVKMI